MGFKPVGADATNLVHGAILSKRAVSSGSTKVITATPYETSIPSTIAAKPDGTTLFITPEMKKLYETTFSESIAEIVWCSTEVFMRTDNTVLNLFKEVVERDDGTKVLEWRAVSFPIRCAHIAGSTMSDGVIAAIHNGSVYTGFALLSKGKTVWHKNQREVITGEYLFGTKWRNDPSFSSAQTVSFSAADGFQVWSNCLGAWDQVVSAPITDIEYSASSGGTHTTASAVILGDGRTFGITECTYSYFHPVGVLYYSVSWRVRFRLFSCCASGAWEEIKDVTSSSAVGQVSELYFVEHVLPYWLRGGWLLPVYFYGVFIYHPELLYGLSSRVVEVPTDITIGMVSDPVANSWYVGREVLSCVGGVWKTVASGRWSCVPAIAGRNAYLDDYSMSLASTELWFVMEQRTLDFSYYGYGWETSTVHIIDSVTATTRLSVGKSVNATYVGAMSLAVFSSLGGDTRLVDCASGQVLSLGQPTFVSHNALGTTAWAKYSTDSEERFVVYSCARASVWELVGSFSFATGDSASVTCSYDGRTFCVMSSTVPASIVSCVSGSWGTYAAPVDTGCVISTDGRAVLLSGGKRYRYYKNAWRELFSRNPDDPSVAALKSARRPERLVYTDTEVTTCGVVVNNNEEGVFAHTMWFATDGIRSDVYTNFFYDAFIGGYGYVACVRTKDKNMIVSVYGDKQCACVVRMPISTTVRSARMWDVIDVTAENVEFSTDSKHAFGVRDEFCVNAREYYPSSNRVRHTLLSGVGTATNNTVFGTASDFDESTNEVFKKPPRRNIPAALLCIDADRVSIYGW